ncbi:MAG TPA: type II toxin-antitoxin system PemK/MazF family toxin [Firmicutes bacterium]|nr:type II toxin-antitoxin system PemK/MazF family toxin [Bacillota bacterium]
MDYQWNMFWANLNPARGSEQAGMGPVLVISTEEVNQALPIVAVLSITSWKPGRKIYPVEVLAKAADTGLLQDSIVMAHQVRAISKDRLGEICGSIKSEELKNSIQGAVKLYLGLC